MAELKKILQGMFPNISTIEEKYILTKEEEDKAIFNAIDSSKRFIAWKFFNQGLNEDSIWLKMAEIDFEKEIDREEVLKVANKNKHSEILRKEQYEQYVDKEKKEEEELKKKCSAKYMFRLMSWTSLNIYDKKLEVDNFNSFYIKALCFFVSRDKRFETELGFSLNKGLLIRGHPDRGKTHMLKCIQYNELNPLLILSAIAVTKEIKDYGDYRINMGGNKILVIDDFGSEEPTVVYYQTKITFFRDFLETYYFNKNSYNNLIISTNLNNKSIEEFYGKRVKSRNEEMFNVITVDGNDRRK